MDFPTDDDEKGEQTGGPDADEELVDPTESAEKIAEKLQIFASRLSVQRAKWIASRASAGHDRRWAEDLDQYNGKDASNRQASQMMTSVEQGYPSTGQATRPARSTVYVQVTRQKTNAMAARLADIVLPTDERNFGVAPTPVPGLPAFVQPMSSPQGPAQPNSGTAPPNMGTPGPVSAANAAPPGAPPIGGPQPAAQTPGPQPTPPGQANPSTQTAQAPTPTQTPISQAAQKLIDDQAEAHKRAEAMQLKIEDAYDECDYNAEARKVVFDMALFGVGVMKGPVVINRTRKVWSKRVDALGRASWSLEVAHVLDPASFRIDPRHFYPDPACGDNVQNGRGAYEMETLTPKQVRDLGKQPGYMREQLLAVLEEGPQVGKALSAAAENEDRDVTADEVYEHWIYWGEVDREDLIAAGVDIGDDELVVTSACIEMINSTVVRAYLNPLSDENCLPYDMVPCERIPGSVFGYGVPFLMRSQQRVINAAWRMILDNAGVSSGPQIVVNPSVIQPADKNWNISARKIWYATGEAEDVRKAFATFEFASHQQELSSIIEMADKLSDQETAVPMLTQGQQGSGPDTVGGMQMLMNSANVMLRRLVKQVDDYLTKPHVRRYYSYFMEYSEDEDIKGDFMVVALGSSSLVVKDIQNQAITNMLTLGTNPAYAPLIDLKKLFARAVKAQHIDPSDIMNTDAQIQAAQQAAQANQQPDPRVQASQIRADADKERTQAQVEMNQAAQRTKQVIEEHHTSIRMEELRLEREIAMLQVSAKQGLSVNAIKAQLAAVAIRERSKQDMHAKDQAMEAQQPQADLEAAQAQESLNLQNVKQKHEADIAQQFEKHQLDTSQQTETHNEEVRRAAEAHQAELDQAEAAHAQEIAHANEQHRAQLKRDAAAARAAEKKPTKPKPKGK